MNQEVPREVDVEEVYRVLAEEAKEFQEYLDFLETLPQESMFPPVSIETGSTTTPDRELD